MDSAQGGLPRSIGSGTPAQITIQVHALDSRSILDRSQEIAMAVRQAMLETPSCPARTIEQASVWPDCIKPLGERFSYAYSWHYQNAYLPSRKYLANHARRAL